MKREVGKIGEWKEETQKRRTVTLVVRKLRVKKIGRSPDRVTRANPDN